MLPITQAWEEIPRALTQGTAVKYRLWSVPLFRESLFPLTLSKVGWHPLPTGARMPRPMPVQPGWLTVAGAARQFPQKREADPSSHATHSWEAERNLKCLADAQPTCYIQRSFSGVILLKTHRHLLYFRFFWLNISNRRSCSWTRNQDYERFISPTIINDSSNWDFKKDSQFLPCHFCLQNQSSLRGNYAHVTEVISF